MTDYYPLIAKAVAKAVASLENAQDRRTLYERGRNALMDELKAVDPPLRQSIIAREQLAFEDAVRKVEAQVARRTSGPK